MNATLAPRPSPASPAPGYTAVRYQHTPGFVELLQRLRVSLMVGTDQAGKLLAVGTHEGRVDISFHAFDQVMGLALSPGKLAVGTRRQVWFLQSAPGLAPRVKPAGKHDACFLTRSCHFTGPIHGHDMGWAGDELWVVNTRFSCLCTLDDRHSFVPRWRPPFVTALAAEDRCHLNGLAIAGGRPRYVTCLGESDAQGGWRENKAAGGCVLDVDSGEAVVRGLSMPHSPRLHQDELRVLD